MALRFLATPALVLAVAGALPWPAAAQTAEDLARLSGGPVDIDHFGGNAGSTTVPARLFTGLPAPDTFGYSTFFYPGHPGGAVTGSTELELPNGAEIVQLCAIAFDSTWHGAASLELIGQEYPAVPGQPLTAARTVLVTSSDANGTTPGAAMPCATPATPVRVGSAADVDGDGDYGWAAYRLRATIGYGPAGGIVDGSLHDGAVSFGAALVWWRRTVSPAPPTARFADVPPTHPLFRFVEALAASGITGGCDASSFCPDAPLTRGQMAVFLAVALGLHWMN